MKHYPKGQRVRAGGIVDRDDEGVSVHKRFEVDSKGFANVKLWVVEVPDHLKELDSEGVKIPVCLEECWPQQYWELAEQSGWLIERPKKHIFSEKFFHTLIEQDLKLSEYLDPAHLIYFYSCANPNVETHAKTLWAEHMISLPDEELETAAASILVMLDKMIENLLPS